MKLIQPIKHATCMAVLSAFIVGCGGANDSPDPMENVAPPTPGEGPGLSIKQYRQEQEEQERKMVELKKLQQIASAERREIANRFMQRPTAREIAEWSWPKEIVGRYRMDIGYDWRGIKLYGNGKVEFWESGEDKARLGNWELNDPIEGGLEDGMKVWPNEIILRRRGSFQYYYWRVNTDGNITHVANKYELDPEDSLGRGIIHKRINLDLSKQLTFKKIK